MAGDSRPDEEGEEDDPERAAAGQFDTSTVDRSSAVADQVSTQRRALTLDLSACNFIDSTALRLVLQLQRTLGGDLGRGFAVVVGESPVQRMFSHHGH